MRRSFIFPPVRYGGFEDGLACGDVRLESQHVYLLSCVCVTVQGSHDYSILG